MKIQNCKVGMRVVGKTTGNRYEITGVLPNGEVEVELSSPICVLKYTTKPEYLRKVLKEIKP